MFYYCINILTIMYDLVGQGVTVSERVELSLKSTCGGRWKGQIRRTLV